MKLTFGWLWLMWFVDVVYDVAVSHFGIFTGRSLAQRMVEDVSIAFFLLSAWVLIRVSKWIAPSDDEAAA